MSVSNVGQSDSVTSSPNWISEPQSRSGATSLFFNEYDTGIFKRVLNGL